MPLAFAEFVFTGYAIKYIAEAKSELICQPGGVCLDRFTKTALCIMVIITSVISLGAYLGYLGGGDNAGVDGAVETLAAPYAGSDGIKAKFSNRVLQDIFLPMKN